MTSKNELVNKIIGHTAYTLDSGVGINLVKQLSKLNMDALYILESFMEKPRPQNYRQGIQTSITRHNLRTLLQFMKDEQAHEATLCISHDEGGDSIQLFMSDGGGLPVTKAILKARES